MLTQQRDRADALLKTADIGCLHSETWCLRTLLLDFVATEGATAARLSYRGRGPVMAGKEASSLPSEELPNVSRIAHFEFNRKGKPSYLIQVKSQDGNAMLTIRGDIQLANQIFLDRYGLGQSGETFLTDQRGFFLTPPKYPGQTGESRPIGGKPIEACLAGMDGEVPGEGYRGVAVIHGFRSVPEIGGGCIMALIDQAEAFAPTKADRARSAQRYRVLLAMIAIGYSLVNVGAIILAAHEAAHWPRAIPQRGDFDNPVPVGGPARSADVRPDFSGDGRFSEELACRAGRVRGTNQKHRSRVLTMRFAAFDKQWRLYLRQRPRHRSKAAGFSRADFGKNVWQLYPDSVGTTIHAGAVPRYGSQRSQSCISKNITRPSISGSKWMPIRPKTVWRSSGVMSPSASVLTKGSNEPRSWKASAS